MLFDIYNPHVNQTVTADYVRIIEESLKRAGHQTARIETLEKTAQNKEKGVVVILMSDVRKAKKAGYGKVIRWVQGASEAESFMRHHSWLRFWMISIIHKWTLDRSDFILFCSDTMKKYYEKKFHRVYGNSYIMPCFNDEPNKASYLTDNKYTNNVFMYAGALDVWQCFEPTVAMYREIEKRVDNCSFRVLVKDQEKAAAILEKHGVERYSLGFVPKEAIAAEMAKAKFGFCLREDNTVNRVATPTKLSTYISHGVMPIYSEYIEDFHTIAKDCAYCFCANPEGYAPAVERIVEMCEKDLSADDIYTVYQDTFGNYYSAGYHIEQLTKKFQNMGEV